MIPNSSSGETNQDSEPNIAVNPANPLEIAATSFTPSPNAGSSNSPVFFSNDGGSTWSLKDLIAGTPVRDQTLRFSSTSGMLYAGVLWGPGGISTINFDILRTNDFTGADADVPAGAQDQRRPAVRPGGHGAGGARRGQGPGLCRQQRSCAGERSLYDGPLAGRGDCRARDRNFRDRRPLGGRGTVFKRGRPSTPTGQSTRSTTRSSGPQRRATW